MVVILSPLEAPAWAAILFLP